MKIPRITVRRLMTVVAVAGVGLWLGTTARRVQRHPGDFIAHLMQDRTTGALTIEEHRVPASFWDRYVRSLLGLPWPGDYPCRCRLRPDPTKRELISAADSRALEPTFFRLSIVRSRAEEHRHAAEDLRRSPDSKKRGVVYRVESPLIGDASWRRFLGGIAIKRMSVEQHERLHRIYHAAATSPTILTDPPVVEPE